MQPKNISEFKNLIERYESITLFEIKEKWENVEVSVDILPHITLNNINARNLTGFGTSQTCILCKACEKCLDCVYGESFACLDDMLKKSYFKIQNSNTPEMLFEAFKERAKVLREFAEKHEIDIS